MPDPIYHRCGRMAAVCWDGGIDLNGWLVREGWAIAYRRFSCDCIWAGSFIPPMRTAIARNHKLGMII